MSDFSDLPWFLQEYIHERRWDTFRDVQTEAFETFRKSDGHMIIASATSSGKTEAALFPAIASLYKEPVKGIGALYIGPLKALIDDQFERIIPMLEKSEIKVTGWHGDISASKKNSLLKRPEGILQITPESLQNIIVNHNEDLKRMFSSLRFVIIDEIHSFIPSPRGAQILCCLETLERICGCRPRRIGLSATIGNMDSAIDWISANTGKDVTVVGDSGKRASEIRIVYNDFPASSYEDSVPRKKAITRYYRDLFDSVKGHDTLIFTNSRASAERTARSLKTVAEREGLGSIVFVHHGSISKEYRKAAEERMKDPFRKTVTVATSSLELGIDVGAMERIVQIDPPLTCMSMLQRMGRSGRRGGDQDITIVCNDDSDKPWMTVFGVSVNLIRSIAIAELAEEGWSEPLKEDPLPYGLLFHQTLEHMASGIGCRYSELKDTVLSMYPFRNISEDEYKLLLRSMVASGILERMDDGTLLIGRQGERLVFGHDFCSVFDVRPEIDIYIDGRHLGSIQELPEIGDRIQLAGRMWQVISISEGSSRADVRPSDEGSCSPWKSDVPPVDDRVMEKMLEILSSDTEYDYLDDAAKECLAHSRTSFRMSEMGSLFTLTEWGLRICPWKGSDAFDTIRRIVERTVDGTVYAFMPYFIEARTKRPGLVEHEIREHTRSKIPKLVTDDDDLFRGKFDQYLPRKLLVKTFIHNHLRY